MDAIYAKGWLLVHYLTFEPTRAGELSRYLHEINAGQPSDRAALAAFGNLEKLQSDVDHYLGAAKMSYMNIAADRLKVGAVTVTELSPGAAAIMSDRIRSARGVDKKLAQTVVTSMRAKAAPYPADPSVQRALAEAEFDAGNLDAAEAAADRALAADPHLTGALLFKARVGFARAAKSNDPAAWQKARSSVIAANRADTENPEPLMLYYRSFQMAKATPPASAIKGLYYASVLAPEANGLRVIAAWQHLVDGDVPAAHEALAPVAYDPHGGPEAAWATGVLKVMETAGAAKALSAWSSTQVASTPAG